MKFFILTIHAAILACVCANGSQQGYNYGPPALSGSAGGDYQSGFSGSSGPVSSYVPPAPGPSYHSGGAGQSGPVSSYIPPAPGTSYHSGGAAQSGPVSSYIPPAPAADGSASVQEYHSGPAQSYQAGPAAQSGGPVSSYIPPAPGNSYHSAPGAQSGPVSSYIPPAGQSSGGSSSDYEQHGQDGYKYRTVRRRVFRYRRY